MKIIPSKSTQNYLKKTRKIRWSQGLDASPLLPRFDGVLDSLKLPLIIKILVMALSSQRLKSKTEEGVEDQTFSKSQSWSYLKDQPLPQIFVKMP